jgi:hypothetical protein
MSILATNVHLEALATELASGPRGIQHPTHLLRAVERVRGLYNRGPAVDVSHDRVDRAVRALATNGIAALRPSQRFMLANALSQSPPVLGNQTILESRHATHLLGAWEHDAHIGQLRALHWRGLFHSYLQAPPTEHVARLRKLLRASLPALCDRAKVRPRWMDTASRHHSLLSDSPCAAYAKELVNGEQALLADLTEEVSVPPASWFWRTLSETLCEYVSALNDVDFHGKIEFGISLAQGRLKTYRDQILTALLNRLARSARRPRHNALLEFSLSVWRSPQLASSISWAQVRPAAKQMVCAWLAEQDLRDFYLLCQDDRKVDEERLEYWLRFTHQITFSQIVLGTALRDSTDRDAKDFRRRHSGRLAYLSGATSSNNAILMQIGDWLFVEFSETGNACYGYKMDRLPFRTGAQTYAIGDLRNPQTIDSLRGCRLIHRQAWQGEIFDPALRARGIRPDPENTKSEQAKPRISAAIARVFPPHLLSEIHESNGRVTDSRSEGGLLVVRLPSFSTSIDSELRRIGFKWSRDAGYWLK